MKKLTTILLLTIGFASSVSAHHLSPSDDAGANISEESAHLTMSF